MRLNLFDHVGQSILFLYSNPSGTWHFGLQDQMSNVPLHLGNVTYISFQIFPDMSSGKLDFWKPSLLTMEASLWATPYRKLEICALGFWFYRTWVSTAMDQGLHQQVFDTQSITWVTFPSVFICSVSPTFLLIFLYSYEIWGLLLFSTYEIVS